MLAKLQWSLNQSIALDFVQVVVIESTSLQIPILLRSGASPRNPTEAAVISIIHSSGMNLHKVQRIKKEFCVCLSHILSGRQEVPCH